jgi:PIN domain nuclease of toxin-antitoxin system
VIVLDTASWIWLASDPKRFSAAARRALASASERLVSAISVWEVAMLVAKRRIQLDRPVDQWVDVALGLPGVRLAMLEPSVAIRSTRLPGPFHPDPCDRIIVATALERGAAVLTPDERIRSYPHVHSIW